MKSKPKHLHFISFLLLLLCIPLFLCSCNRLSAKYEYRVAEENVALTLDFTLNGKIRIYLDTFEHGETPTEILEYRIDDDIIYIWNSEQDESTATPSSFSRGRDAIGDYICIGERQYYKR